MHFLLPKDNIFKNIINYLYPMKPLKFKRTHIELPLSGRWLRPTIVPLVIFTITLEVFPSKVWFLLNTSKMLSLFHKIFRL